MDYLDEGDHREAEGGEDEPRLEHDVLLGEGEGDDPEIDDIASFVELLRDDVEGEDRDHGHHHVLDRAEVVLLLQLRQQALLLHERLLREQLFPQLHFLLRLALVLAGCLLAELCH